MKVKDLRELLDFIASSGLDEVNIETPDFKISTRRNTQVQVQAAQPVIVPAAVSNAPVTNSATTKKEHDPAPAESSSDSKYVEIKSPMIGTFYRSSNPETPPFASEGDLIKAGQTVCIIEAMKLFNEIESEISGRIVKVLVQNASPVEFDQPLFLVDPS